MPGSSPGMVSCGSSSAGPRPGGQRSQTLAKSQKKSNKEVRKPKATIAKPSVGLAKPENQVNALMNKPKAKV